MQMMDKIVALLTSIALLWAGSVEYRVRNLTKEGNDIPDRSEVDNTINIKLEATNVLLSEIKEDIKELRENSRRLEDKFDNRR